MVRSNENEKVRQMGNKVLRKTKFFHVAFALIILLGYFFAGCSEKVVYPNSFVAGDLVFCLMYYMINKIQSEDMNKCWEDNLSEKEAIAKKYTDA